MASNNPSGLQEIEPELQTFNLQDKQEATAEANTATPIATQGAFGCESKVLQEKQSNKLDLEKLFEEINKLDRSLLPPELQSLDLEELKRIYDKADSISILVTGKIGSGKSTLINGILGVKIMGEKVAKEGGGRKPCTTEVNEYCTTKGKIKVTVWDSPGLQDGKSEKDQKKYLHQMMSKCGNRDLTVFCIRISDIRFVGGEDNPDVQVMQKLTEAFGPEFWETTIIVLTFANVLEALNVDWEYLSPNDKAKEFQAKLQDWEEGIKEILTEDFNVPQNIVDNITIIPAGHYKKPHLPGCRYWLSNLWFTCVGTIPSPEKKAALVRINADRIRMEENTTENEFAVEPEQQPIILQSRLSVAEYYSRVYRALIDQSNPNSSFDRYMCSIAAAILAVNFKVARSIESLF